MDNKVNNFFQNLPSLKERIKSRIPESCTQMAEKIGINRKENEHEMGTFRTFEQPGGSMGGMPDGTTTTNPFCEYQEGGDVGGGYNGDGGGGGGGYYGKQEMIDPHTGLGAGKITSWQAGWNVTNAIQGMFIVCLPFAVLHGGYWGVFALVFVAYICCYTGKILVECLYEMDEVTGQMVRVRDSYASIAEAVVGPQYGGKLVNCAQIIELLMTCILYVVLCGDLLIGTYPEGIIDQRSWMMLCTLLLLPCAFLTDLRAVSTLSFWCTVTHIMLNIIIFGYCFVNIGNWQWSKVTFRLDGATFPITLGIVVFSYTSQIFLPTLEGSMQNPDQFNEMLDWSHIAAALFKGLFAYVGFLTFGEETQDVITNNLPTRGFRMLVNLTLVAKALLSYPLPYYAVVNLFESALFRGKPTAERPDGDGLQPFPTCWGRDNDLRVWALTLRVLLVLGTMFMAISIPHFALLMGLIGNFTGAMLSFIWPCYFHMALKWKTLGVQTIAWEVFIIVTGFLCAIVGVITSFAALVEAYHLPVPYSVRHPIE